MKLIRNITKVLALSFAIILCFSGSLFSQPPPPDPGGNNGSSIIGSMILLLLFGSIYATGYMQNLKLKLFKKSI